MTTYTKNLRVEKKATGMIGVDEFKLQLHTSCGCREFKGADVLWK